MSRTAEPSQQATPKVHPSAYVAPSAVLLGDVRIGAESVVLHGAVLSAVDGSITVGRNTVIMENAVIRSSSHAHCAIGSYVMVGPHCHLSGCTIEDEVFIATGASVFNGAHIKIHSEVRIGGVVHINTVLEPEATVPIGWIAVGNPAQIFPPDQHEALWAVQKELNFPLAVFGQDRTAVSPDSLVKRMLEKYSRFLAEKMNAQPGAQALGR